MCMYRYITDVVWQLSNRQTLRYAKTTLSLTNNVERVVMNIGKTEYTVTLCLTWLAKFIIRYDGKSVVEFYNTTGHCSNGIFILYQNEKSRYYLSWHADGRLAAYDHGNDQIYSNLEHTAECAVENSIVKQAMLAHIHYLWQHPRIFPNTSLTVHRSAPTLAVDVSRLSQQ